MCSRLFSRSPARPASSLVFQLRSYLAAKKKNITAWFCPKLVKHLLQLGSFHWFPTGRTSCREASPCCHSPAEHGGAKPTGFGTTRLGCGAGMGLGLKSCGAGEQGAGGAGAIAVRVRAARRGVKVPDRNLPWQSEVEGLAASSSSLPALMSRAPDWTA